MSNSLEELKARIKANKLKEKIKGEEFTSLSSFDQFITYHQVESGKDKIETFILYETYLESVKRFDKHLPMSKIDFFRTLCKHIKRVRHNNQRYYLINRSKFKLSQEEEFRLKVNEKVRKEKKIF